MKKIIVQLCLLSSFVFAIFILSIGKVSAQCWKSVADGNYFAIGLKSDSTLWQWGYFSGFTTGIPTQIASTYRWKLITAGAYHSVALRSDNTLWAWGYNYEGELGDGTYEYRDSPVQIGNDTNWVSISTESFHTLAIKSDGTLWAWGLNSNGQLGDGTTTTKNTPTQVGNSTGWKAVSAGSFSSTALRADGTLWAWGQVGEATQVPTQVGFDTDWRLVEGGSYRYFAIKNNGTLWACGNNANGELGDGTNIAQPFPIQIDTGTNWESVSSREIHTSGLKSDGTLWAWGDNGRGQLGDGTYISRNVPTKIGADNNWTSVGAGYFHSHAIKSDNTLWGWGRNDFGQLGDGSNADKNIPTQIMCNTTLPVIMTSFSIQKQKNTAVLSWRIVMEQNSKEYQIERSADGVIFNVIGTVASKNNPSGSHYTYVDAYPLSGNNYYRLKSIDIDGKFSYSNIDEITFNLNANNVIVYPNPAKNILTVQSNFKGEKLNISITDLAGRKILETIKQNNQLIEIPITSLKTGFYLIKINDGITSVSKKIIKE